jgi:Fic family protein
MWNSREAVGNDRLLACQVSFTGRSTALLRVKPGTIEEKVQRLRELEAQAQPDQLADYNFRFEMSWIHHDNALEGIVYEPSELIAALNNRVASDTALIPVYDEIRQYKAGIDLIRDLATKKRQEITLDTIKALHATLEPEEAESKGPPTYRKDMPLHRVYFHDIATPDKIPQGMRTLLHWLSSEDTRRTMHPTRIAARAHYQFLHIFPFPKHSGKVGRLLMNLLLLREGYPPAILHATDRQRYYDALKTSSDALAAIINEALDNAIESGTRYWHKLLGIDDEDVE